MQLSELIKNYSINTVSQKTNISVEVLEKLINHEWDKLQQTKVNGFLQIIEREFAVDLSDIKEEAKEYYAQHKKEQPNRPIDLVDAEVDNSSGKKILANILTTIIIILVAYAGWYYLANKDNNQNSLSNTTIGGMFKDSINIAKDSIKNSNGGIENNDTNSSKNKEIIKESKKEPVEQNSSNNKELLNSSIKNRKFDINLASNESLKNNQENISDTRIEEKNSSKIENNLKTEQNSSSISMQKEKSVALEETPKESNLNNSIIDNQIQGDVNLSNFEDNRSIKESNKTDNEIVDVNLDENVSTVEESVTKSDNGVPNIITITPTVNKIWIGIYNLKTKKRVVKVATGSYEYNTEGGDVAIVTGHSKFKIATDTGANSEYNDARKRKYLLITKDGIKVLTKQEYREVTKRRAW